MLALEEPANEQREDEMRGILRASLTAVASAAVLLSAGNVGAQSTDNTIRFATASIAPSFGRPEQGTASPSVYTLWPMYDSLTRVSPQGDVSGLLASSWKNIDASTWEVTLKRGVKFHDGTELTSKQVVDQFTYLVSNEEAAGTVAFSTNQRQAFVQTAEAVGDYTIRFTTTQPNPELPRQLAGFWIPETGTRDDLGTDVFSKEPVGTGPYMKPVFTGGVDGFIELVAFDDALRKPNIPNLRIQALREAATRVTSILSDEIDIAQGVPFDSKAQLEGGGHRVDIASRPSAMGWRFMSVRQNSPFHDKRVRQAANYAIDRQSIADDLLGGTTVPAGQCATRFTFGYNPQVKPYPYDPGKAKQLLAEAGFPDGFETEIMVIPGAFPADAEIYQFAAQQLGAVGIRAKLTQITFAQWLDMWFAKKKGPEGGLGFSDIFQNSCHNFNAIPFDSYPNLSCKKDPGSHCDAAETAKLDEAMGEFDVEKRRKLVQELMVLNNENAPNLFFVELTDLTGLNKRVNGFTNIIQRFNFHEITLN
jgi:peptide/nickel transport system substrate-binding protein